MRRALDIPEKTPYQDFTEQLYKYINPHIGYGIFKKEPMNQLIDVYNAVFSSNNYYAQQLQKFWLFDYNLVDPLSQATIKALSKSQYDQIKFINILANNQPILFKPIIAVKDQQLAASSLSRVFEVRMRQANFMDVQESDIQNARLMTQLLQSIFGQERNEIKRLMDKGLDQLNQQITNEQQNKYFITIQCLTQFSGISDIEYIKASIILYTIHESLDQNQQFERLQYFIQESFPWLAVKFAQILQDVDVRQFRDIQHNTQYFNSGYQHALTNYELYQIQLTQGAQIVPYQNNILYQPIEKFDIRTAYTRIFNVRRQLLNSFKVHISQQNQMDAQQRQTILHIQDRDINIEDMALDIDTDEVSRGIKGPVIDILVDIYLRKLGDYYLINQFEEQFQSMIVIISIVLQIPIREYNLLQDNQMVNNYLNNEFNRDIQNPIQQTERLQQEQLSDKGWSQYMTINLQRNIYEYDQIIPADTEQLRQSFRNQILQNLELSINHYQNSEEQEKRIQSALIANGIEFAMVRQVRIRPITFFNNVTYNALQETRQFLNLENNRSNNQQITSGFNAQSHFTPQQIRKSLRTNLQGMHTYKSLLSNLDYEMEETYNDLDIHKQNINCCQRIANIIQDKSSLKQLDKFEVNEISQLIKFIDQIQQIDDKKYVHSLDYFPQFDYDQIQILQNIDVNETIIIYIGQNHVFAGTLLRFKQKYNIRKIKPPQDKRIYQQNTIKDQIEKFVKIGRRKGISLAKIIYNKRYSRIYFDFETTYDDLFDSVKKKGVKQRDNLQSYEQVEFAYSMIIDMKIQFRQIIENIIIDLQIQNCQRQQLKSRDFIFANIHESLWKLKCGIDLVQFINKLQDSLNEFIVDYNTDLYYIKSISNDIKIEDFKITNEIYAYSYNGSKFDNHFILSAIKDIEGQNKWFQFIQYIGEPSCMKILSYRNIKFCDIKLMTAGQSLKQFCKDMNLNSDQSKMDFDMNNMKTYSIAQQHKDEIMKYVMMDSISMRLIHRKFEKSIRMIIQDAMVNAEKEEDRMIQTDIINKQNIPAYLLKGYFNNWFTISSLSLKIFNNFFLEYNIQSDHQDLNYKFMQQSYQGGYTQAYSIGEYSDTEVYYYDYNSMYPSIMANLNVPIKLNMTTFIDKLITVQRHDVFKIGININSDPLFIRDNMFNMQLIAGDYNLYQIEMFEFFDSCFSPCFGLVTKQHGTIYPLKFDSSKDKQLLSQNLVVFGFQISMAFSQNILKQVTVSMQMKFQFDSYPKPLFKKFDEYMYNARLKYKNEKNSSMAACVKVFINSLYGKYGEKHHDSEFIMKSSDVENEQKYKGLIMNNLDKIHGINNQNGYNMLQDVKIKNYPMYDLNDRDLNLTRVKIEDIPMKNQHIGSFVYYASLITAIGRMQITSIANKMTGLSRVLYIDTDSIVLNRQGSEQLINQNIAEIHSTKLGALKNEYPLHDNQNKSSIQRFVVFNKKIYQYMINDKWTNKFKGCRDVNDDMREQFYQGQCQYIQHQQRFKKNNGNVTIIDFDMKFKLRLSRRVQNKGKFAFTHPYDDLEQLRKDYGRTEAKIRFDQNMQQWIVDQ